MTIFYWAAGVLLAALALTAAFNFMLYLSTGEPVPQERARRFGRHTTLVALTSFNIVLFKHVVTTFIALVRG